MSLERRPNLSEHPKLQLQPMASCLGKLERVSVVAARGAVGQPPVIGGDYI